MKVKNILLSILAILWFPFEFVIIPIVKWILDMLILSVLSVYFIATDKVFKLLGKEGI